MSPIDTSEQVANLKNAIASLEAQRDVLGEAVVSASIDALQKQLAELEGQVEPAGQQRKLVTVLFLDVVESTKISEHLDPEDVMEIMEGGLQRFAEVIQDEGGRVLRFMGDGLLAAFGVPQAHEDAPVHAILAGLEIQSQAKDYARALEEQWGIQGYQVRVGVNTGLVAVGGMTEADETVMGSAVNLGARLESAAPPGGVLISQDTYRHVRGLFDLEPMPPIQAKGFSDPVPVYLVNGVKQRSLWLSNRGVEGVETQMVGRESELKYLQDALILAIEEGTGQMVTVVGEAGVGKSRLFYEFQTWCERLPQEVKLFFARGRQEAQNQPYALLRDLFSFHFQIQEDDPLPAVNDKFERGYLEAVGDLPYQGLVPPIDRKYDAHEDFPLPNIARAHYLGQLLGFDFSKSPHLSGIQDDPQGLRDQALIFLEEYFRKVVEKGPVVIALEDLHWADDSTLDVANRLCRIAPALPMLVLCLSRPSLFERRPHWGEGQENHTRLDLRSLSKTESRELVTHILQKVERVPEELRELVVQGAEGNPFYIEELIKMLVEDGVILKETGNRHSESFSSQDFKGPERWQVQMERLGSIKIPPTLTGVLQARLDSLSPQERKVLQEASVVGRTFWDRVVAHLQSSEGLIAEDEIPANLSALRDKEMIFRREESTFAGTREYLFKHEILREVTYETVLKKIRRRYHGLVADWLISNGAEREREYAGLIGDHLQQAGRHAEAVDFLIQAGLIAQQVYANEEAVQYYRRSLEILADLPNIPESETLILETYERLGDILELTGKHPAAREAYQSALDRLSGRDPIRQARLLGMIAASRLEEREYKQAEEEYQAAIAILSYPSGENQAAFWQEWIRIQLGRIWMKYWMGRTLEIQELVEQVGPIVEQFGLPEQRARYYNALVQVDFRRDRYRLTAITVSKARKALEAIQVAGRLHEQTETIFHLGFALLWHGNLQEAERYIQASLRIAERTGDIKMQSRSLTYLTLIHRRKGNLEIVKDYTAQSLKTSERARIPVYIAMAQANQAWIDLQEGNFTQVEGNALPALDQWEQSLNLYPFKWAALWPLIAVALTQQKVAEAVGYACRILDPSQQLLPEALAAALEESVQAWDDGRSEESLASLKNAIQIAQETGWY